jgi:hypothetical protein
VATLTKVQQDNDFQRSRQRSPRLTRQRFPEAMATLTKFNKATLSRGRGRLSGMSKSPDPLGRRSTKKKFSIFLKYFFLKKLEKYDLT